MRHHFRSLTSLFIIAGLAFSGAALAQGKKKPRKGKKKPVPTEETAPAAEDAASSSSSAAGAAAAPAHYGMAGCGLGSMLIKDHQSKVSQFLASLLNGTGMQSSAITLGTSNCVSGKTSGGESAALYIRDNYATLAKEAAQGGGASLAGLSHLMGCQNSAAFAEASQNHYEQIYAPGQADQVINSYQAVIATDPQLVASCTRG